MYKSLTLTTIEKSLVQPMSYHIPLNPNIITELSKNEFINALNINQGALVIKFGATWCGPCKKIDSLVNGLMNKLPPTIQGAVIDIDESFELYALLKSKRIMKGVPAIICYKNGNKTIIPDHVVVGIDEIQIELFFTQCMKYV